MPHESERVAESQATVKRVSKIGMKLTATLFLVLLASSFFYGVLPQAGRPASAGAVVVAPQNQPWQDFVIRGDSEIRGPFVGPGITFRIWASDSFIIVGGLPKGGAKAYHMPAGYSSWNGDEPSDLLRLKNFRGIESDTVRFQKVR